jgi:hypothetical protein
MDYLKKVRCAGLVWHLKKIKKDKKIKNEQKKSSEKTQIFGDT